ncbi:Cytidine deaminase 1 [Bienertia sinuspersici]
MAKKLGLKSVIKLLPIIVKSSQKLARPPISGFSVAAVGLASDGRIFVGVNVEFPGLPLHHSIHAEQFLITNLSLYPQTHLKNIVVSAYPCGHCRQFLQEIRGAPDIQILVLNSSNNFDDENGIFNQINEDGFIPLSHFLPHRFGPDDLLDKDVPLILETRDNNLVLKDAENGELCNGYLAFDGKKLIPAAFEAANKSHAPYSGCPSGVALIDEFGNIFKGSYMESAAYNPSMGPAQAAFIAYMAMAKGGDGGVVGASFDRIVGAVLVEVEGALVRQEETVRLLLMKASPKCEFHVYHCMKSGSSTMMG